MDKLIAQTKDDLNSSFNFFIEKAEATDSDGEMIISGVASSTNVDHDSERMSLDALHQMANKINSEGVPLRIEHQKTDGAVVGEVISAEVDPRNRLLIKAKVSRENPAGLMLHNALKGGLKMGFSVGGRVKRAYRELSEGAGKLVKTFYDILLDEVSVTPRPSNYDSWADTKYGVIAKSLDHDVLYGQFLTENPKLDYLAVIEKSIPDTAWEKVETKNELTNMNIKKNSSTKEEETKAESTMTEEEKAESTEEMDEKAESTPTEEEEKAESSESSEETKTASIKYVDQKFDEVISLLKSIQKATETTQTEAVTPDDASEQHDPDQATEEGRKEPKAKTRKSDIDATQETDGTLSHERESGKGGEIHEDAHAQNDPDADMENHEVQAKARKALKVSETDTSEESEKTESDESSDSDKKNTYGEEYKLSAISEALKSRGNLSNIDAFVAYVTKTIEDMKDSLKAHNKRVLGLEKSVAESIKSDESIQKSIQTWMKEPGQKKSVSLGVPYAVTKEGMRLRLVPEDFTIAKSVDKKANFKQVWGSNFMSQDFN